MVHANTGFTYVSVGGGAQRAIHAASKRGLSGEASGGRRGAAGRYRAVTSARAGRAVSCARPAPFPRPRYVPPPNHRP
ncbi:unnamed protein product, partial [Iphiclides podalirius]